MAIAVLKYQLLPLIRSTLQRSLHACERGKNNIIIPPPLSGLPKQSRGRHYHALPELVFQISGESRLLCSNYTATVQRGDVFITPSCMPHVEQIQPSAEPFLNLVLLFYDDGLTLHTAEGVSRTVPTVRQATRITSQRTPAMLSYVERMIEYNAMTERKHTEVARGLSMALISEIIEALDQHQTDSGEPQKINACKNYVLINLSSHTLSVKTLAEWVQWTPDYLSYAFHSATGMRLQEYITAQRLELARRLLTGSTLSIAEISYACGYADPSYFNRIFRKTLGCTPGAYRQQQGFRMPG
jgi:AraC-like DNA-binding protein